MTEIRNVETGEIRKLAPQSVERFPGPFSVGPRIVRKALCADGSQRSAYCSALGADTFFSIPAHVKVRGRTVAGYVTRSTLNGFSTETPADPAVWKFVHYPGRKNGGLIERQEWCSAAEGS